MRFAGRAAALFESGGNGRPGLAILNTDSTKTRKILALQTGGANAKEMSRVSAVLFAALILSGCQRTGLVRAVNGEAVVDSPGPVEIRGEWHFFPGVFLSRNDPGISPMRVNVPGSWNRYTAPHGFGTYRLMIRGLRGPAAISMMEAGTSARLYVDGRLICESGIPGTDAAGTEPQTLPLICNIGYLESDIAVTIEAANFHYRKGGLWNPIVTGDRVRVFRHFEAGRDLELMLAAVMLVMSVYHVMLFVYNRHDTLPLAFGLFAGFVFLRTISTNYRVITEFLPGLPFGVYNRIELLSWFWVAPLGLHYTTLLFPGLLGERPLRVFYAAAMAESLSLFLPSRLYSYVVPASQIVSVGAFVLCVIIPLRAWKEGRPAAMPFLLSVFIAVAGVGNDFLHTNEVFRTAHVAPYGLLLVIVAHALLLSRNLLRTHELLRQSDHRYRIMIEGSRRMILSLDRELRFIAANRTLARVLGSAAEDLPGKSFLDCIVDIAGPQGPRAIVRETLEKICDTGEPGRLTVQLVQAVGDKPITASFVFEVIELAGRWELLGRAETDLQDALLESLEREDQEYRLSNSLAEAEELSHRISRRLTRYMPAEDAAQVRLALFEVLVNAIEHGNLEIDFATKSNVLEQGDYIAFLRDRSREPHLRTRHVHVRYSLTPECARFEVRDQGKGFDFDASPPQNETALHGRGLMIARSTFDIVAFTAPGNVVLLEKQLRKGGAETAARA